MKQRPYHKGVVGAVALVAVLTLVPCLPRPVSAVEEEWPRRFQDSKGEVVMYQPQLEDFKDDRLTGRAAVSAKRKEWRAPVFGAVWMDARVAVDRDSRTARIYEVKVTDVKFPSTKPEEQANVKSFLNEQIEGDVMTISLDRLLTAMEVVEKQRAMDDNLNNDPPKIIYRNQPAVLIPLEGEPRLLPIPLTTLMRVANTPFMMLYAPADKTYYLRAGESWVTSFAVQGPWQLVESLPSSISELEEKVKRERAGQTKAAESEKKVELKAGELPEIIVSTVPSELIVTEGEPQYTPIENTHLLYVSNTENNIFMDTSSQQFFVLLSGRWFSGASLEDGPWAYVPSTKLPAEFARIPEGSVKGFVLVSIAGTQQAREAVMDTYIPQTAAIDRKKATIEVKYDGAPQFEKIPDSTVEYAVNTADAVFRVSGKYYACADAVWYESGSANGPWKVSVDVPKAVYSIPPSNPHYNSRYVKVYDSTDDVATVGYTPGYTGTYVDNGAVVYGTGYPYRPYYTPTTYIPYPPTYGFSPVYDPYASAWGYQPVYYNPYSWLAPAIVGIGVGLAVAAIADDWWDDHDHRGYYRGWWGYGGYRYHNMHHIHHHHHRHASWRPRSTPYWRPGDRSTWRPGDRTWRTGDRLGRRGERPVALPANRPNLYNRPGMENRLADASRIRPARADRIEARSQRQAATAERRAARQGRPASAQLRNNNVFADKEGNVFRRDARGNWQQREGGRWSNVDRPDRGQVRAQRREVDRAARREATRPAQRPSADANALNREFRARERGAQRSNEFRRSQEFRPQSSVGRPSGRADRSSIQRGGGGGRGGDGGGGRAARGARGGGDGGEGNRGGGGGRGGGGRR